jgi:hypothetical protein
MQIYFSHSYRDVAVNSYFIDRLAREDIPLGADQKTDVWCVAKLERYLADSNGFISVISRRATDKDPGGYSAYIGRELNLARRARVPRLLFVDQQVLRLHRIDFPEDAISFDPAEPSADAKRQDQIIRSFRVGVETAARARRDFRPGTAVIIASSASLHDVARDAADILRRQQFDAAPLIGRFEDRGLDDIRLLETLWKAELCVFLLGERISDAHVALAMAHAHAIPSIRLLHDRQAETCEAGVTGVIRWRDRDQMLVEFERQVMSYRSGLVRPVELAQASSASDAAKSMANMRWHPRSDNYWPMHYGNALLAHVQPDQGFVRDEANRVARSFGRSLAQARSREDAGAICRLIYEGIKRHRFGYEFEPYSPQPGLQVVRTPAQMEMHRTASCLDLACLFAGIMETAGQAPLVVVLDGPSFAHAMVGVRMPGEPSWIKPELGDLRRAISLGDAMFFEPTGAVEADAPVAAEKDTERQDKMLTFSTAREAAERMVGRSDIRIRHVLDVLALRAHARGNGEG